VLFTGNSRQVGNCRVAEKRAIDSEFIMAIDLCVKRHVSTPGKPDLSVLAKSLLAFFCDRDVVSLQECSKLHVNAYKDRRF